METKLKAKETENGLSNEYDKSIVGRTPELLLL